MELIPGVYGKTEENKNLRKVQYEIQIRPQGYRGGGGERERERTCLGQSFGRVTHTRGRNIPFAILTSLWGLRVFSSLLKQEEKKRREI